MDFWKWFVPGIKVKRWLAVLFGGIVLLALGVAYILVHFYRTAPFPEWVGLVTLQFIPRLVRGLLFLLVGVGMFVLAWYKLSQTLLAALSSDREERSLAEMVYQRRRSERGKHVVIIGASTGTVLLLRALHQQERPLNVRVISTGLESSRVFSRIEREVRALGGRILFPTQEDVALYTELEDDSLLSGLDALGAPGKAPIRRVFLGRKIKEAGVMGDGFRQLVLQSQDSLAPSEEAITALEQAELLILGPASLYTGLLPCLTPPLVQAIQRGRAAKLFICNIMTEPGQTEGYSLSDHLRALHRHCGLRADYVLVNTGTVSDRVLARYASENATPVLYNPQVDHASSCLSFDGNAETILVEGAILLERDLVAEIRDEIPVQVDDRLEKRSMVVIRHDADKLARAVQELMERRLAWGYSA